MLTAAPRHPRSGGPLAPPRSRIPQGGGLDSALRTTAEKVFPRRIARRMDFCGRALAEPSTPLASQSLCILGLALESCLDPPSASSPLAEAPAAIFLS